MAYYPDTDRLETVLSHMRECDDRGEEVYQRELHEALGMNKNAVWILEEWEKLTDVQKERLISALERIAEGQDRILEHLGAGGPTYNIQTATINNNPRIEVPERRMPKMEVKTIPEGTE